MAFYHKQEGIDKLFYIGPQSISIWLNIDSQMQTEAEKECNEETI